MAEIRINATGGLKLYDADDSHYAQIVAGTITSNVDALTLGSSSATFNIPVTVGVDDTGHDVKFFGASAGAYALWDESANLLDLRGATAAGPGYLKLTTGELTVVDADKLGRIDFQAPVESDGTDSIAIAASIWAEADDTFAAGVNNTDLVFALGKSETAAEKFRFTADTEIGIGGANYGTDGQVLTSGGAGAACAWEDAGGAVTALNNATQSELVTVGSTTTELDAEANLTFTGSALTCIGTITTGVDNTGHDVKFFGATSGSYFEWDESADDLNLIASGLGVITAKDLGVGIHIRTSDSSASAHANADELVIEQNGHAGLTIASATSNYGTINFADSGDNDIGLIRYDHSDDSMQFFGNAVQSLRINANGRIGIYTASPGQILDVNSGGGNTIADGYDTHSLTLYKENIENASGYLDKVIACPARKWNRKPFVSAEEIKIATIAQFGQAAWDVYFDPDVADSHRKKAIYNMPEGEMKTWIEEWCEARRVERRPEEKWQKKKIGLVADEEITATHLPEVISKNEDGEVSGIDTMSYIGILHNAIQELEARVTSLGG